MSKAALILLDLQNGILDRIKDHDVLAYLSPTASAQTAARAANIPVIHIRTCFRPSHPEVSARNLMFGRIGSMGGFVDGDATVAFAPAVAPKEGDIVVTKRRVSGFSGSDLDCVLRGLGVDSLVLGGIATSGAVLSTVRQAADLDFKLTVLEDLCLDLDVETHRVLVEKVFPRQCRVMSSVQWIEEIGKK